MDTYVDTYIHTYVHASIVILHHFIAVYSELPLIWACLYSDYQRWIRTYVSEGHYQTHNVIRTYICNSTHTYIHKVCIRIHGAYCIAGVPWWACLPSPEQRTWRASWRGGAGQHRAASSAFQLHTHTHKHKHKQLHTSSFAQKRSEGYPSLERHHL